jgi:hypothetical protein
LIYFGEDVDIALGAWEPVAASGASAAAVAQVTAALDTRLRFDVCVFLMRETSGACLNCNTFPFTSL